MTWCLTVVSLIGVALNIRKRRECFLIWMFTNAGWCVYDGAIGAWAQAVLFGIYFVMAVWGWFAWRNDGL